MPRLLALLSVASGLSSYICSSSWLGRAGCRVGVDIINISMRYVHLTYVEQVRAVVFILMLLACLLLAALEALLTRGVIMP